MAWPANVSFSGSAAQDISTLSAPHAWADNTGPGGIVIGVQAQDYCITSDENVNVYRWTDAPPAADYRAQVTIRQRAALKRGWSGPVCRAVTGVETYYTAVQLQNSFNTGNPINEVRLFKYVSGVQTQLDAVANTLAQGQDYTLKLEATGAGPVTLNVWLDGALIIGPIVDSSGPITAAGFAGIFQVGTRQFGDTDHLETRAFLTENIGPPVVVFVQTNPIRNNTGTLLPNLSGLTAQIRHATTLAHIATITNETTDANGVMRLEHASLMQGVAYIVDAMDSTGKMLHAQVYTAQV